MNPHGDGTSSAADRVRSGLDRLHARGRARDACDFLPAALEIEDRPPSRTARVLLWALVALVCSAVLWGWLGRVDMVAVAHGKIVPSGRSKVVQPLATASVVAIHVRDGQAVRAGDLLIELDPTVSDAEATRSQAELSAAEAELGREQAYAAYLQGDSGEQRRRSAALDAAQRRLLAERIAERQSQQRALEQGILRRRAELVATEQTIERHRKTLPLVEERTRSLRRMADQNLIARHTYIEAEERRITAEQDLATAEAQGDSLRAAIDELAAQREQLISGSLRETLARIEELDTRVTALRSENTKAREFQSQQRLVAPVTGVVQQLRAHTVGGVVTPAEPLLVIVPDGQELEIEAQVLNKDIGWVHEGQPARVKLEAFPFTRYGVVDGEVVDVSNDAIVDERQGLVYAARVKVRQAGIRVERREVPLSPGMAVSVEIKTGTRRLIDYFLSPIRAHVDESLKER